MRSNSVLWYQAPLEQYGWSVCGATHANANASLSTSKRTCKLPRLLWDKRKRRRKEWKKIPFPYACFRICFHVNITNESAIATERANGRKRSVAYTPYCITAPNAHTCSVNRRLAHVCPCVCIGVTCERRLCLHRSYVWTCLCFHWSYVWTCLCLHWSHVCMPLVYAFELRVHAACACIWVTCVHRLCLHRSYAWTPLVLAFALLLITLAVHTLSDRTVCARLFFQMAFSMFSNDNKNL